ncbi:uncharacterized protein LOC131149605 [Malania oleifera]|uniref:uncharacterized protein LOC131149605 n=1 Tax=Malania oleifera TaxID=397392 RepID=UPI0025AE6029|nr:uncharacterized protein LOC131149605 [Malania oleifera]
MNAHGSPNDNGWVLDSRSSIHVCFKKEFFHSFKKVCGTISLSNESSCDVRGIGSVKLKMPVGAVCILDDVNFVPRMRRNLISLSRLDSKGCQISIVGGAMEVTRRDSIIFTGKESCGLYQLMGTTVVGGLTLNDDSGTSSETNSSVELWAWELILAKVEIVRRCGSNGCQQPHHPAEIFEAGDGQPPTIYLPC